MIHRQPGQSVFRAVLALALVWALTAAAAPAPPEVVAPTYPTTAPALLAPEVAGLRVATAPAHAIWLDALDLSLVRQIWGKANAGRSVIGRPLRITGIGFAHGVGAAGLSRMAIDLKGAALRFTAVAGMDDGPPPNPANPNRGTPTGIRFTVCVDGKVAADTGVLTSKDPARLVSVDLRGAHHLLLTASDGTDFNRANYADWAGAMLILDPAAAQKPATIEPPDGLRDDRPATPGHYLLRMPWTLDGQPYPGRYDLFLPDGFGTDKTKKYPLLVFLHGLGEVNPVPELVRRGGIPRLLDTNPAFRKSCPFIVLSPQLVRGMRWDDVNGAHYAEAAIEDVCRSYPVDTDRVYATGLSLGGSGTWRVAMEYPDRFAAIAPLCGRCIEPTLAGERLKDLPVWAFVGDTDGPFTVGTRQMAAALKAVGGHIRLTIFPGFRHGIWDNVYPLPDLYTWLLAHRRGQAGPENPGDLDKVSVTEVTNPIPLPVPPPVVVPAAPGKAAAGNGAAPANATARVAPVPVQAGPVRP
jgi:dienelactone hydrolase